MIKHLESNNLNYTIDLIKCNYMNLIFVLAPILP